MTNESASLLTLASRSQSYKPPLLLAVCYVRPAGEEPMVPRPLQALEGGSIHRLLHRRRVILPGSWMTTSMAPTPGISWTTARLSAAMTKRRLRVYLRLERLGKLVQFCFDASVKQF